MEEQSLSSLNNINQLLSSSSDCSEHSSNRIQSSSHSTPSSHEPSSLFHSLKDLDVFRSNNSFSFFLTSDVIQSIFHNYFDQIDAYKNYASCLKRVEIMLVSFIYSYVDRF